MIRWRKITGDSFLMRSIATVAKRAASLPVAVLAQAFARALRCSALLKRLCCSCLARRVAHGEHSVAGQHADWHAAAL